MKDTKENQEARYWEQNSVLENKGIGLLAKQEKNAKSEAGKTI